MVNKRCSHDSWVGLPESGEIFYPEQEGLRQGELRCTAGCGRTFASEEELLRSQGTGVSEDLACLDANDGPCTGAVELRHALSASGRSYPRCDGHWKKRLDKQQEINERYAPFSDVPPSGFDPADAGECWEDEW
jgi:hypothetical protein